MAKHNACIIGAGNMGKHHAQAWASHPNAKVVAISDRDSQRGQALAKELGARYFDNYQDAISHEPVNVVSIATPTYLHSEIACFAAEKGRHVLTEKPLALTLEQGQAMVDAAGKNQVKIAVSFQYRDGVVGKWAELFAKGAFGGPVVMHFSDIREVRPNTLMHRKDKNGGPVIDMACHYFDLMRFITDAEPRRVFARGFAYGKGKERVKDIKDPAIDTAIIMVEYDGGHILDFNVNWGMPEGFKAKSSQYLMGPNAASEPDGNTLKVNYADHQELWEVPPLTYPPERRIDDLVQAIEQNRRPQRTAEDGLIALKTSFAALKSIETGLPVEVK